MILNQNRVMDSPWAACGLGAVCLLLPLGGGLSTLTCAALLRTITAAKPVARRRPRPVDRNARKVSFDPAACHWSEPAAGRWRSGRASGEHEQASLSSGHCLPWTAGIRGNQ